MVLQFNKNVWQTGNIEFRYSKHYRQSKTNENRCTLDLVLVKKIILIYFTRGRKVIPCE